MVFDETVVIPLAILIGVITALIKEWASERDIKRRKNKNVKFKFSENHHCRSSRPRS